MIRLISLLLISGLTSFAAVGSWNGVAFTAWNDVAQTAWNGSGVSCASGTSYLIQQNFEGTGYDHSEVWNEGSNPDEDYTTAPAPLEGSQSIFFRAVTTSVRTFSPTFAAQSTAEAYFLYRPTTIGLGGDTIFLFRNNGGSVTTLQIDIDATGHLRCDDGTITSNYTDDAAAVGTTWHVWLRYVKGTGINAQYSVAFSSDGVRPTSGTAKFSSTSIGVSTVDTDQLRMSAESGTCAWIGDKVRVANTTIGNNPS
jgi:hypothetical protein